MHQKEMDISLSVVRCHRLRRQCVLCELGWRRQRRQLVYRPFLREYTLLQVKVKFRSPYTNAVDYAYYVNHVGDVFNGGISVGWDSSELYTLHQKKYQFRSPTVINVGAYYVSSDGVVDTYWLVTDSYGMYFKSSKRNSLRGISFYSGRN